MEYRRIITVANETEARQVAEILNTHGIPTKIAECQPVEGSQDPAWIVSVYEAEYMRAKYVVEDLQ